MVNVVIQKILRTRFYRTSVRRDKKKIDLNGNYSVLDRFSSWPTAGVLHGVDERRPFLNTLNKQRRAIKISVGQTKSLSRYITSVSTYKTAKTKTPRETSFNLSNGNRTVRCVQSKILAEHEFFHRYEIFRPFPFRITFVVIYYARAVFFQDVWKY